MAGLTEALIADLVATTLKDFGKGRYTQIAQSLVRFEVMPRIMKKDKVVFQSGISIQADVMIKGTGSARNVGLYQTDNVNVPDVMQQIQIPWRHTETSWAFDVRELLMNRSKSRIVNLLNIRRDGGQLSLVELQESNFWAKPADSTDTTEPFGVPYWVVKNASEGFNGGNPSGFSAGAGSLDASAFPTWRNYTARYATVNKTDLLKKMRKAHRNIGFMSPIDVTDFRKGRGQNYRIYVNEATISSMEDIGEAQNENLGRDLASMDETMTFRKHPIIFTAKLDADSTNPVYMLDFSQIYPVVLAGDVFRETGPNQAPNQHNVRNVFIDLSWNLVCYDRRRQAVLNTA